MTQDFEIKFINCTEQELSDIGFDSTYTKKGILKHRFISVKISNLTCAQANIIKQTAISTGTDCAVHREVITGKIDLSDCILSGSISHFEKIAEKLKYQPFKLAQLSQQLKNILSQKPAELHLRNTIFDWSRPYIMGILNVTPDSFSDGGKFYTLENAINHYKKLIEDGADIIDIGGESTRPYSEKITTEEEINRILPVIKEIRKIDNQTILSVDTRNAKTAQSALEAGCDIVNDVSAMDWDKDMLNVIKNYQCPIILNHSTAAPDKMQDKLYDGKIVDEIYDYLSKKIDTLTQNGLDKSKIIIDPGIGFGKTTKQNFEIINRLNELKTLCCPILVGHSRKNFLKETINTDDTDALDTATLIMSQKIIANGASIVRVHNVKAHTILKKLQKASFLL